MNAVEYTTHHILEIALQYHIQTSKIKVYIGR